MLRLLKNLNGQGIIVQYALTFALVMAVILGMNVYLKRLVQSRVAGARDFAAQEINAVLQDTSLNLVRKFSVQYEPYYTQTHVQRTTDGAVVDRTEGGIGVGSVHSKEYQNYQTTFEVVSNQLSPKDAD